MKRIIVILSLTIMVGTASAQIFGSSPTQDPASITRVYLWDKPVTDSLNYKGVLPGDMFVVTAFTFDGRPVMVLFDAIQYKQAQGYFTDSFMKANIGRIVGYEYVVTYIGKFSWMKKRDRKSVV